MEPTAYLQRIKHTKKPANEQSLSYLSDLQYQHMLHVPFENQDLMRKVPIALDVEKFYEKVVLRRSGGFCYELNGLFCWLLEELGFDATLISGTVRKPDGSWALKDSHATIMVQLEEEYLVDVGFGDSVRIPVPLSGEIVNDGFSTYRVRTEGDNLFLERKKNGEWIILYSFCTIPKQLSDFTSMCHYNQTSPNSRFTQESIATIATPQGRITLLNESLKIREGQTKRVQQLQRENKIELLKKHFGIDLH